MAPGRLRVAVIGAGAAGLCSARHLLSRPLTFEPPVVFETSGQLGGTWVYMEKGESGEEGSHIHSNMYRGLRTNLPKELMGFPDFTFDPSLPSFVHHTDVLRYLDEYADRFSIRPHIKYHCHVVSVTPVLGGGDSGRVPWDVTWREESDSHAVTRRFDAVMVCVGNYSHPVTPAIPGIGSFQGTVLHSQRYRSPEVFSSQTVVLLGSGPSGVDIALELAPHARQVTLSHRGPPLRCALPKNMTQAPPVIGASPQALICEDGTQLRADTLIYCTGYRYHYPFLESWGGGGGFMGGLEESEGLPASEGGVQGIGGLQEGGALLEGPPQSGRLLAPEWGLEESGGMSGSEGGLKRSGGLLAPKGGLERSGGLLESERGPDGSGGLLTPKGGLERSGGLLAPKGGLERSGGLLESERGPDGSGGLLESERGPDGSGGLLESERGPDGSGGLLESERGPDGSGGLLESERGPDGSGGLLAPKGGLERSGGLLESEMGSDGSGGLLTPERGPDGSGGLLPPGLGLLEYNDLLATHTGPGHLPPLYNHLLHAGYPTLCFVGVCKSVIPFPLFHAQVLFFLAALEGRCQLPPAGQMLSESREELRSHLAAGGAPKYLHRMERRQWGYHGWLAETGGFPPLPPVVEKMFGACQAFREADPMRYRDMNLEIVSREEWRVMGEGRRDIV